MLSLKVLAAALPLVLLASIGETRAQSATPRLYGCPARDGLGYNLCYGDFGSEAPGDSASIVCYYSNVAGSPPPDNGCPTGEMGSDGSSASTGANGESRYYCIYAKSSGLLTGGTAGACSLNAVRETGSRLRARHQRPAQPQSAQNLRKRVDMLRALIADKEAKKKRCADGSEADRARC